MTDLSDPQERERVRRAHSRNDRPFAGGTYGCRGCYDHWPCDTITALDLIERQAGELETLRANDDALLEQAHAFVTTALVMHHTVDCEHPGRISECSDEWCRQRTAFLRAIEARYDARVLSISDSREGNDE